MKRILALIGLLALLVTSGYTEPWSGLAMTITPATAQRIVKNRTLALSLFFQMTTGGTGRGYVLFAPSGVTCAKGGAGTTLIAELSPASSTAPGGNITISGLSSTEGAVDVSLYCVDGSAADPVTVAWNLRN